MFNPKRVIRTRYISGLIEGCRHVIKIHGKYYRIHDLSGAKYQKLNTRYVDDLAPTVTRASADTTLLTTNPISEKVALKGSKICNTENPESLGRNFIIRHVALVAIAEIANLVPYT